MGACHAGRRDAGRRGSTDAAPAEVVLRFNEAVAPVAVRVIDAGGAAVVAVAPPPGETLTIALPAGLSLIHI